jgi:hypothetical protein
MIEDDRMVIAVEHDDQEALRGLAAGGSAEAMDALVEIAGERGDVSELRRLASAGSEHAAELLADLTDD